ncbi:hypothetical protein ACH4TE_25115 [Streptomyces sioyaensis]|uniref:hypothetical protein n=1 Tax=Streptomyces sioyaensis TaxID=67364 RepID=UPI0037B97034
MIALDEIAQELTRADLFTYSGEAVAVIEDFCEKWVACASELSAEVPRMRKLMLLAAAEFSLIPSFLMPANYGTPFKVRGDDAMLALLKSDTTPNWPFHMQAISEGRARSLLSSVDLSVFSADIAKLFLMNPEWWHKLDGPSELWKAVEEIEQIHRECPWRPLKVLGESSLLKIQGLLWQLRLTVINHSGFEGEASAVISSFVDYWRSVRQGDS